MTTNNFWKRNFVLVFLLLIGMMAFASAVTWNDTSYVNPYYFTEDTIYYYNFTANLSNVTDLSDFQMLNITWVNGTVGTSQSDYYWLPWNDTGFSNSITGVLKLNATRNNETGNFTLNVLAQGTNGGVAKFFNFIIDAVNDPPNFFLNSSYDTPVSIAGNKTKNISLVGSDEEKQYPLVYNVSFDNCSFASWSSRNNSNCSLDYKMFGDSNTTSTLAFSNLSYNDAGVYNLTICAHDDVNATPLPLYRVSNYDENKTTCKNTTLILLSSLSIDASNCSGAIVTEGEQFNCTINITTVDSSDDLNISSYAFFQDGETNVPDNRSWFYANASNTSNDFTYSIPISILPTKREVGNWTINFTATDGKTIIIEPIDLFVNWTESYPSLDSIPDMTIYSDENFTVKGYDDDLLILDKIVRNEILTYASNTSWVSVTSPSQTNLKNNWTTSTIAINYTNVSLGNHSVVINVTDKAGNPAYRTFTIQVLNDTAPEWNSSLPNPVFLNLTENKSFLYNVSTNVSDANNDSISFYYQNNSEEFCSLNSSTFNSTSGIMNFTPTDCDVGLHNVTIIASDGMLNSTSHQFIFNISNIDDAPTIFSFTGTNATGQYPLNNGSTFVVPNGDNSSFSLVIDDDDFLIPLAQRTDYYNESLTVVTNFTNSTGDSVDLFNFSFVEFENPSPQSASYNASFTPDISQVGNYTAFINITDKSGNSTNRTFFLKVVSANSPPNLTLIENQSLSINDYLNFTVNATDTEDNYYGINLTYSIANLSSGSPNLTVGNESGLIEFNMSSNESYAGKWKYNVTVTDSGGLTDSRVFYLYVYGTPNITAPFSNQTFDWSEGTPTGNLNFSINYSVNDTNLTYLFYLDKIIYSNSTTFKYFNQTMISPDNLRNETNWIWTNESNFSWNFTPSYTDESYGKFKNLTLVVYNSQYPNLNDSINWKVNISHTNQNVTFILNISNQSGYINAGLSLNLSKYFEDADYWDKTINQIVNFTISTQANYTNNIQHGSSFNNWMLKLNSNTPTTEVIKITAHEYNSTNVSIGNATSNWFEVTLKNPPIKKKVVTVTVTTTKLKYYAMRIIVPHDIIISNQNFIKIPFSLQNTGAVDLSGINLSSQVLYNNAFSNNVKVSLGKTFIKSLKIGETKNYTMTILADTSKSGRYKATLFANVTSPKFSDWGDFFIDLKKTNETEVEQRLIFTEKLVAENPECLELTELVKRARSAFSAGNLPLALQTANKVSSACKKAIMANEQIRYKPEGFVRKNLYNISFLTLIIFVIGFALYIYKRVRFNKSDIDDYSR